MRGLAALGVAAIVCSAPLTARAQATLQTEVSSNKVEVGDTFQLQVTALASPDGPMPSGPKLAVPQGITARGPSVSTQTRVSVVNGRMSRSVGITATWFLVAARPGKYRIGPPSIEVSGRREQGNPVVVEVLPQGALPRRGNRMGPGFDPFDFFDPFGRMPFPRGSLDQGDDFSGDLPPVPPEYQVDRAPDPLAFVRTRATPEKVVVGQQITFDTFGYGARGPFRISNVTEPSRPDFLAFAVEDAEDSAVRVPIDDDVWIAQRLRQYALVPLKAGKLSIGAVQVLFSGDRYGGRRPLERSSEPLEVVVEEPPLAGRPPGYRLGDVGKYTLTASVEPRKAAAGDAVSVVARLEGVGNVPSALAVPEQTGVEWLEPTVVSDVEPRGGVVGGFRSFTYVVKLTEQGRVELGDLSVSYWDPEAKAYRTARADLGVIEVGPGSAAKPAVESKASPLEHLGKPRTALGPVKTRSHLTDRAWFWWLVLGAPLGVVLADGGVRLSRFLSGRRRAKKNDPRTLAEAALQEARRAPANEPGKAASAVERALFLAIEAGTGLRARALLKNELSPALERAGVAAEQARAIVELLSDCETARFTEAAPERTPSDWVSRAEPLTRALLRLKRTSSSPERD